MSKIYVLDTNVLIHDPAALYKFEDNDVVIPMIVIEELDGLKKSQGEVGAHARAAIRSIDGLREEAHLCDGVQLETGGSLTVAFSSSGNMPHQDFCRDNNDNLIVSVAAELTEQCLNTGIDVILISKDANVRIKANATGVFSQDYLNDKVDYDHLYSGTRQLDVGMATVDALYSTGNACYVDVDGTELFPNEMLLLSAFDSQQKGLARVCPVTGNLLKVSKHAPMELVPRNLEQKLAVDLLMNPDIPLVTLVGKAGTGKTLLALAAGLDCVLEEHSYRRVLVTRPAIPMGKDLGFLPGDLEEKLSPWMAPIEDNIDVLLQGNPARNSKDGASVTHTEMLKMQGNLEVGSTSHIRGRSIPGQYIIVDEAQNLTPLEVKTIITRAGEGTKIVLTGDPEQIDTPYLDAESNGLTYVAERFKRSPLAGHITMTKGERSNLAAEAAELL